MARNTNGTGFSLKDHLFNESKVRYLAGLLSVAYPALKAEDFVKQVMETLPKLELKERINHIAQVLYEYLPKEYSEACKVVVAALPPPLDPDRTDDDFGDFIFAPLGEYVVRYGSADDVSVSLSTLYELTKRFSMEDAIRFFINTYPEVTLTTLRVWTTDKNYHVRRLVSEGLRPRLPWSLRLNIPHITAIPYLDTLYKDNTRYVTRSVANHLNDISKIDPDLVVSTLTHWGAEEGQSEDEFAWMKKHALRTLIKQGYQPALVLLGYASETKVNIVKSLISPASITSGESVTVTVELVSPAPAAVLLDYRIGFKKRAGNHAYKTYKLKVIKLQANKPVTIEKKHKLRADATTYTLYPGEHFMSLLINGVEYALGSFVVDC